jgi:F420-dependent oxidoreductase-like protein
MTTRRIGLVVARPTPTAAVEAIVRAEQHGVPAVWSTVGGTSPDALTMFAAAAVRTQRVLLGTSIVPVYPRHPLALASQVLALSDLAPGRFRLGIGPSHRPTIEGMYGLPFVKPLSYLREYLTVLRHLLWEGRADVAGEFFNVTAELPAGLAPPRTPLLISALRAGSFHLAGEIADGAISWVCPVPYLMQTALPALRAGAEAAGRPVPPLIAHVPVALSTDRAAVHVAARRRLALYGRLPFYARMFAEAGYPPQADGTLPDALLDELVVAGNAAQVVSRLEEIEAQGPDELLVMVIPVADADAEELALLRALREAA